MSRESECVCVRVCVRERERERERGREMLRISYCFSVIIACMAGSTPLSGSKCVYNTRPAASASHSESYVL